MAGERILLVEDNEKNCKLLRNVLQLNGYEARESEASTSRKCYPSSASF